MITKEYKRKLKRELKKIGTYEPRFDLSLQIVSEELSRRDEIKEVYKLLGDKPIIKDSEGNYIENMAYKLLRESDQSILPYLTILGLTPTAIKEVQIKEKEEKPKTQKQEQTQERDIFDNWFDEVRGENKQISVLEEIEKLEAQVQPKDKELEIEE